MCHAETSDSLCHTPSGRRPSPASPGSPRGVSLHPCPFPSEDQAASGPERGPSPGPPSPLRTVPRPGTPRGWGGAPGCLPIPQPSCPNPAQEEARPLPRGVSQGNSGPPLLRLGPHSSRQIPRGEHSPSCPARPARLPLRLGLAADGAGVAVWPCGPVALRPGRGAERGPLPLSARPAGSPRPRPRRLPRPRQPAAAAAGATARWPRDPPAGAPLAT